MINEISEAKTAKTGAMLLCRARLVQFSYGRLGNPTGNLTAALTFRNMGLFLNSLIRP